MRCLLLLLWCAVSCSAESIWTAKNAILQLRTSPSKPDSPPSYMVQLYNRYRKGRMPYSSANTVRSFFATQGRLGSRDLLVFNLTGVHPTEYVERVDLHLRSRGLTAKQVARLDQRKAQVEVDILDLSRPDRPKVETIPLARAQSSSWQTLDITDSIIACLEGEVGQHHLVGVSVKGGDLGDDIMSQPFIVLFSEDDDHLSIEELERDPARNKREILNNELPDYPPLKADGAEVQARLKHRPLDTVAPPRKSETEKHRKRRRRRRRKDKRLPYAWGKSWWKKSDLKDNPDYEGDEEDEEEEEEQDDPPREVELCQKKRMVVSFAEIGWGDWVISPKTFDASFCSGACPHPLKKSLQSSNHASIQSLLQSLGVKKDVPELCCVPHTLAPLSLLYYDQNRNIVLKSFPDMSVQNCSCR